MNRKESVSPNDWKIGTSYTPNGNFNLSGIKEVGFDCIEIVLSGEREYLNSDRFRTTYDPVIAEAKKLNLEIWTIHLPFSSFWDLSTVDLAERERIIENHSHWLDWVHEIGVKKVVVHPSFEPISDSERPDRLKACLESLQDLAKKAHKLDITICVENLPRTCLGNTSEEILSLLNDPTLKVCCDTNHMLQEKPEDFIRKVGTHIATTHISDYDGIDEKHWIPNKGVIHWTEVMRALADIGYEGPFIYEVGGVKEPNELMENWQDLLSRYNEHEEN